jgi:hypothetical protein
MLLGKVKTKERKKKFVGIKEDEVGGTCGTHGEG